MQGFILAQTAFMPTEGRKVHVALLFRGTNGDEIKAQLTLQLGDSIGDTIASFKSTAERLKQKTILKSEIDKIEWNFCEGGIPDPAQKVWVRVVQEPGYKLALHLKEGKFIDVDSAEQIEANQWLNYYDGAKHNFDKL